MIETSHLLAFALTALLVELTPGPNMGYLAAVASLHGARVGIAMVGGIALGLILLFAAAVTGLSRFVLADHMAFQLVRWAGVAYMFWLAVDALRQHPQLDQDIANSDGIAAFAMRGLVTNLFNVKALLFLTTVLPTFITIGEGAYTAQAIALAATYVSIATLVHTGIALAFSQMITPRVGLLTSRYVSLGYSAILFATAVWLAFAT